MRVRLAVVAVLLVALGPAAARPQPMRPPAGGLAGQLLVATTDMRDPRFAHTVIYMIRHDAGGAQGFVVNRPIGAVPLARLLEQMGMDAAGATGGIRLHAGGPVEALRLFVLHTGEYTSDATIPVRDGIAVTSDPEILRAIAAGKGPRRTLFAIGYAGWAPGQLEAEIEAGAWHRAPSDEAIVFGEDYDKKWERAIARRKIDL